MTRASPRVPARPRARRRRRRRARLARPVPRDRARPCWRRRGPRRATPPHGRRRHEARDATSAVARRSSSPHCRSSPRAAATTTTAAAGDGDRSATLVLNWTPNAHHLGVYAAHELGWYDDAGIDLEIVEPTEAGAEQAVGQGQAEFGISMAEGVLPAREQGIPIVSIGTILPVNDSALMSLADEGIRGPADLAGKTYGGYNGPLETELINRLATCGGIDPVEREPRRGRQRRLPRRPRGEPVRHRVDLQRLGRAARDRCRGQPTST